MERAIRFDLTLHAMMFMQTGLPLLYSTVPDFAAKSPLPQGFRRVRRYVRFAWEEE